jgi:hypothetical protein
MPQTPPQNGKECFVIPTNLETAGQPDASEPTDRRYEIPLNVCGTKFGESGIPSAQDHGKLYHVLRTRTRHAGTSSQSMRFTKDLIVRCAALGGRNI